MMITIKIVIISSIIMLMILSINVVVLNMYSPMALIRIAIHIDTMLDKEARRRVHLDNAVRRHDVKKVERIIKTDSSIVNRMDRHATSPLHYAISFGDTDCIEALLKAGADPDKANINSGLCPIHQTVLQSDVVLTKLLLDNGADINIAAPFRQDTAMHLAVKNGDVQILKLLIQYGPDVNSINEFYLTPLHLASMCDEIESVQLLLSAGADKTIRDSVGKRPIDHARISEITDLLAGTN